MAKRSSRVSKLFEPRRSVILTDRIENRIGLRALLFISQLIVRRICLTRTKNRTGDARARTRRSCRKSAKLRGRAWTRAGSSTFDQERDDRMLPSKTDRKSLARRSDQRAADLADPRLAAPQEPRPKTSAHRLPAHADLAGPGDRAFHPIRRRDRRALWLPSLVSAYMPSSHSSHRARRENRRRSRSQTSIRHLADQHTRSIHAAMERTAPAQSFQRRSFHEQRPALGIVPGSGAQWMSRSDRYLRSRNLSSRIMTGRKNTKRVVWLATGLKAGQILAGRESSRPREAHSERLELLRLVRPPTITV